MYVCMNYTYACACKYVCYTYVCIHVYACITIISLYIGLLVILYVCIYVEIIT